MDELHSLNEEVLQSLQEGFGGGEEINMTSVNSSPSSLSDTSSTVSRGMERFPIYLNVYDLTPLNGYFYWFGVGIYHSGIEAHGVEYGYGAHDYPSSGVFEVEPRNCPGFMYRKTLQIGTTDLNALEFREFIEDLAGNYNGDSYHLIVKNCNHFSSDVCMRLIGKPIPGWVNRLAKLGQLCNCLLPESLQVTAVKHTSEYIEDRSEEIDEGRGRVEIVEIDNEQDRRLLSTSAVPSQPLMQRPKELHLKRILESL